MKFTLQPSPGYYLETVRKSGSSPCPVRYAVYDIADIVSGRRVLNIDVKQEGAPRHADITPSTLTAHRFQTGLYIFHNYHMQWTAEGSVCGTVSLWFFLFVYEMSRGTAEWICAKFTRKMCLIPCSDEFEGQSQGNQGQKQRPACGLCLVKHL